MRNKTFIGVPHEVLHALKGFPENRHARAGYKEGEKVRMATIKPSAMLAMFGAEDLESVAEEVEQVMVESIQEAGKSVQKIG